MRLYIRTLVRTRKNTHAYTHNDTVTHALNQCILFDQRDPHVCVLRIPFFNHRKRPRRARSCSARFSLLFSFHKAPRVAFWGTWSGVSQGYDAVLLITRANTHLHPPVGELIRRLGLRRAVEQPALRLLEHSGLLHRTDLHRVVVS